MKIIIIDFFSKNAFSYESFVILVAIEIKYTHSCIWGPCLHPKCHPSITGRLVYKKIVQGFVSI